MAVVTTSMYCRQASIAIVGVFIVVGSLTVYMLAGSYASRSTLAQPIKLLSKQLEVISSGEVQESQESQESQGSQESQPRSPATQDPHHRQPRTIDSEALRLSEHPDIEARGEFQKAQMKELCEDYVFPGEQSFPAKPGYFYFHLLYTDEQKVLYCYVPKVGCTNMKRLIFYMGGNLPMDTVNKSIIDHQKYLYPAQNKASLANEKLTKKQKEERIDNYFKFMIVRNPLERVLSAYRDKIEYPLLSFGIPENLFPENHKFQILSRERPGELKKWREARKKKEPYDLRVTFPEFCRYMIRAKSDDMNEHFVPSMDLCHPCLTQYDFYGNFRNYSTDSAQLIEKFKTDPKFYQNRSFHKPQNETRLLLQKYYQQLNSEERTKLFERLYDELLFYYTLYPSERNSHQELLGIDTPILVVS